MDELLLCEEVRMVGCIDTLGNAIDALCCGRATPELGAVLNVIDPETLGIYSMN